MAVDAREREQIGRRHIAARLPREAGDRLYRLPPRKTHREPSVQPKNDGSHHPDSKKDDGFSANCRPKNLQVTDREKPQPIDQQVTRDPEKDQANPDSDGRNDELDHGVLLRCLPSGSGNPDRHGLIIAEMKDACRLIRGRDCASRRDSGERSSIAGTAERVKLTLPRPAHSGSSQARPALPDWDQPNWSFCP